MRALCAAVLAVLASPAAALAQAPEDDLIGSLGQRFGWALSSGVSITSGRFGNETGVTTLTAPVIFSVGYEGFTVSASTGVISSWFSAPGTVERTVRLPPRFGGRVVTLPLPGLVESHATGLADTQLSARYEHLLGPAYVAAGASVKLPTASRARGLGTGETDFSLLGEVGAVGPIAPFFGGGYDFLGSPLDLPLRDSPFAYAGLDWRASKRLSLTGQYEFARSPAAALQDAHQLGATLRWRMTQRLRLDVNAGAGLSAGAPDAFGGLRLVLQSN